MLLTAVDIRDGDSPDFGGRDAGHDHRWGGSRKTGGATRPPSDPSGRVASCYDQNISRCLQHRFCHSYIESCLTRSCSSSPIRPIRWLILCECSDSSRVLSSGTYLDSLRFRFHLARQLDVNPNYVEAQILGEHGTSQVFLWSSVRVAGVSPFNALQRMGRSREELSTSHRARCPLRQYRHHRRK